MCTQDETTTHKEQEDGWVKGNGGGRQGLKHIDGDVPMCMRNKGKDVELKSQKTEKVRGEGGGRQRFRHVEGDKDAGGMLCYSVKRGEQTMPRFGRHNKDTYSWVLENPTTNMELGHW